MSAISFTDFVRGVLKVELTPAQSVLARVAYDGAEPGDLEGNDRELAAALFGPIDVIPSQARGVLVLLKGARIGGSYVFAALYSLWRALVADLSGIARGEQASALVVAPDTRLARQVLRYALGAAQGTPSIARLIESETSDSFVMRRSDGALVTIEVLPASRGGASLRGRSLVSAVLSECAFFRDENAVISDSECFRAVAPRVLKGGMVILESTPYTEAGILWELFSKNFAEPSTALAAHAPTLLMRPDEVTRDLVRRETERDAENSAREFSAEFISGGAGTFFGGDILGPAIVPNWEPDPYGPGDVFIGGDLALVSDASAFVALRREGQTLTVLDILEMRPKKGAPLKLSAVVKSAADFAQRHGVRSIRVDHHILDPAREHLPHGITLQACANGQDAKVDRFIRTREAFKQGRVKIPGKHQRLVNQLSLIASKPTAGGSLQIILPRRAGTHQDASAAFVLAVDAASGRRVNAMARALATMVERGRSADQGMTRRPIRF